MGGPASHHGSTSKQPKNTDKDKDPAYPRQLCTQTHTNQHARSASHACLSQPGSQHSYCCIAWSSQARPNTPCGSSCTRPDARRQAGGAQPP